MRPCIDTVIRDQAEGPRPDAPQPEDRPTPPEPPAPSWPALADDEPADAAHPDPDEE
jgi:hypothetical protein